MTADEILELNRCHQLKGSIGDTAILPIYVMGLNLELFLSFLPNSTNIFIWEVTQLSLFRLISMLTAKDYFPVALVRSFSCGFRLLRLDFLTLCFIRSTV